MRHVNLPLSSYISIQIASIQTRQAVKVRWNKSITKRDTDGPVSTAMPFQNSIIYLNSSQYKQIRKKIWHAMLNDHQHLHKLSFRASFPNLGFQFSEFLGNMANGRIRLAKRYIYLYSFIAFNLINCPELPCGRMSGKKIQIINK